MCSVFMFWTDRKLFLTGTDNQITVNYTGLYPTRNIAHVTCMLHAKNKKFHDACLAHVSILTNMHVSCNMQGFGTFYMHVTCVKHAYNMHTHVMTCML